MLDNANEFATRSHWPSLEPEGRGHELLIAWGVHRRGGERPHGVVGKQKYDPPIDPVYEDEPDEVLLIDDIFRGLSRRGCKHAVQIAKLFYLEYPKYDYFEVAGKVRRTEGFVRLTLRGMCELVEREIEE